jgi:hypothetical protein
VFEGGVVLVAVVDVGLAQEEVADLDLILPNLFWLDHLDY